VEALRSGESGIVKYISTFVFEAYIQSESGVGAQVVFVPANAVLENVVISDAPPDRLKMFPDPSDIALGYEGKRYTTTLEEFLEVGACHKLE
jgi:hypothetical protein